MFNSLTTEAGIKIGPLLLETAVKHYFDRILKDHQSSEKEKGKNFTQLRQDELLYDEAFNIVKVSSISSYSHARGSLIRCRPSLKRPRSE